MRKCNWIHIPRNNSFKSTYIIWINRIITNINRWLLYQLRFVQLNHCAWRSAYTSRKLKKVFWVNIMDIYIRFGGDLVVYVRFMFPVVPHSFAECINYSLRLLSIDTMDVLQFLAKLASNKRIKKPSWSHSNRHKIKRTHKRYIPLVEYKIIHNTQSSE